MPDSLENLLRAFRRQLAATHVVRLIAAVVFADVLLWSATLPDATGRRALFLALLAGAGAWVVLILSTVHLARQVQAGALLLATGQFDRAEAWLRRLLSRFSLSVRAKLVAGQQLASLYFRRDAHREVVAICRELLRHRLTGLRDVRVNTRLMLADSLLMLQQVSEAYGAMRPIYDLPLSLSERMKLLPVQLRYELAADHAVVAAQALPEKLQVAELLDPARAALVHALLAEACRRTGRAVEMHFLAERARLYHDLQPLVARYGVIAPVAKG